MKKLIWPTFESSPARVPPGAMPGRLSQASRSAVRRSGMTCDLSSIARLRLGLQAAYHQFDEDAMPANATAYLMAGANVHAVNGGIPTDPRWIDGFLGFRFRLP